MRADRGPAGQAQHLNRRKALWVERQNRVGEVCSPETGCGKPGRLGNRGRSHDDQKQPYGDRPGSDNFLTHDSVLQLFPSGSRDASIPFTRTSPTPLGSAAFPSITVRRDIDCCLFGRPPIPLVPAVIIILGGSVSTSAAVRNVIGNFIFDLRVINLVTVS